MDYKIKSDSAKLEDLLELFGETISAADINASRYLGEISSAIVKKKNGIEHDAERICEAYQSQPGNDFKMGGRRL